MAGSLARSALPNGKSCSRGRRRLQAARRLLTANAEAARAAYAVGYKSASQFSRDCARFFDAPPSQDAGAI